MKPHNSLKGHKGFTKVNRALGQTVPKRVPTNIAKEIDLIIDNLERIASQKGMDTVNKILDNILAGLDNIT
jgi:spore cortex formation protein SpoVR/YcgB (stage V sporulation)